MRRLWLFLPAGFAALVVKATSVLAVWKALCPLCPPCPFCK